MLNASTILGLFISKQSPWIWPKNVFSNLTILRSLSLIRITLNFLLLCLTYFSVIYWWKIMTRLKKLYSLLKTKLSKISLRIKSIVFYIWVVFIVERGRWSFYEAISNKLSKITLNLLKTFQIGILTVCNLGNWCPVWGYWSYRIENTDKQNNIMTKLLC